MSDMLALGILSMGSGIEVQVVRGRIMVELALLRVRVRGRVV